MSFDGVDDYVDCGRAESCAGLDNFTVVVWYFFFKTPSAGFRLGASRL